MVRQEYGKFIWLVTIIVLITLGPVAVFSQAPPPVTTEGSGPVPPPPPVPRNEAAVLANRLFDLETTAVEIQRDIITLQENELSRLDANPPDGPDEDGKAARQQLKMMINQLRQVSSQIRTTAVKLNKFPREALPPQIMSDIYPLKEEREFNREGIAERFEQIKSILSEEDSDELPDSDTFDNEEPDNEENKESGDSEEPTAPESTKEAGDVIGGGEVKTPKHLIEIFERVPENETPKANLNYFKRQKM